MSIADGVPERALEPPAMDAAHMRERLAELRHHLVDAEDSLRHAADCGGATLMGMREELLDLRLALLEQFIHHVHHEEMSLRDA